MSAVATGLRTALLHAKMEVEVGTVPPDVGSNEQGHVQLVERHTPHGVTAVALDTNFGGQEQSS